MAWKLEVMFDISNTSYQYQKGCCVNVYSCLQIDFLCYSPWVQHSTTHYRRIWACMTLTAYSIESLHNTGLPRGVSPFQHVSLPNFCMHFFSSFQATWPSHWNLLNFTNKLLTQWSKVLREKLINVQLIKNFVFSYSPVFNTTFAAACHWNLAWISWNQSTSSNPASLRSILLFFSYLIPFPLKSSV